MFIYCVVSDASDGSSCYHEIFPSSNYLPVSFSASNFSLILVTIATYNACEFINPIDIFIQL